MGVAAVWLTFAPHQTSKTISFFLDLIPEQLRTKILNLLKAKSVPVKSSGRLFTREELKQYRGEGGGDVYLSVLGQVFDVTAGKKHYGPGGSYHFFTGETLGFQEFVYMY